ncbi:exo-alpha-sialidase [Ornithinibacillus gellani]|uniref:sialidase family protein n=1 Tax=Ornithinibacillus gellani TaxID=2293253 RepID=UPI000F47F77E|nr:sialidase family protein [Ornithinibacillus gellani]TQS71161.1 exo-alpha-sialidase [Ornithinibacillus gellani]
MKKAFTMIVIFSMLWISFTSQSLAATEKDDDLVLREENKQIRKNNFTNLNDKVDELKELDEGTIIVRFRYTDNKDVMSLFSLSNNNLANGHFHLYITPNAIGSENRYEKPGEPGSNIHLKANVNLKENEIHTLAMVVDKEEGYKYFLDGELVLEDSTTERKFLNHIFAPNRSQLGRTERAGGANQYHFNGDIDFAEVYRKALSDQALMDITGVTAKDKVENPLPDDAFITEPHSVFYPGLYDSNAYRIPALYHTMDGTLLAGIDKRINHAGDSPANIDMMMRRSLDQGNTWEDEEILINDYPGYASNIDQLLVQDKDTKRIYSLVVAFPEGGGFPTAEQGTGFVTIDGKEYMTLYNSEKEEYTIRENGIVYNGKNEKTDYTVDQKRNLYLNGHKISNIFLADSPLKVANTSFLELWHSDDEGKTWEGPQDMNPGIKEAWMAFLGAGPGSGIQLTEGEHKGRLVLPIYFTNENRQQASAVIYSDDHGETWHRGESPNHGRVVDGEILDERTFTGNEITESQVVEMPDGQLKLFMRNFSGYAQIATSFDGGETWASEVVTEQDLVAPYSQMTAIRYDGQIDGEEAVIFASAGDHTQRVNGTVRAGLIKEDGTYDNGRTKYKFDWKYAQLVKEGSYGYSSLTNLNDGNIGLLYEAGSNMDFIKFNPEYLKWEREAEAPEPEIDSIYVDSEDENFYVGDKLEVKVVFDDFVMLSGDWTMHATIGDKEMVLQLKQKNQLGTEFIFEGEIPELVPGEYNLRAEFSPSLDMINVYGKTLDKSLEKNQLSTILEIENEDSLAESASDVKRIVESLEKQGKFANKDVSDALHLHLTTVEHFENQSKDAKVLKHMNGFNHLIEQYQKKDFISHDAYQILKKHADHLIEKWG